jgi:hypothetical protein
VVQVAGLQGGDTAPGFTQSFASRNAHGIDGSTLLVNQASGQVDDGKGGNNYTITFASAQGTIKPEALTVPCVL